DEPHQRLFVCCRSGHVVVFDSNTGKELQSLPIAKGVGDMVFRRRQQAPVLDRQCYYQRVLLGWTGNPAHTQSVTWRTEKPPATPKVQFAIDSATPEFANGAAAVPAKISSLEIDVDPEKLVLHAWSAENEQLDGFQLEKKNGRSVYSDL